MYKTCCSCATDKTLSEFRRDARRIDGLRSECKKCSREKNHAQYAKGGHVVARARSQVRHREVSEYTTAVKRRLGCCLCEENEPACLDFHHVDASSKKFSIGGNTNRSLDLIVEEIQKCAVLCRNHHAKVHAGLITLLNRSIISPK